MLDGGNDGNQVVTIVDNGWGDLDSTLGEMLYTGSLSGFLVNLTYAASNSPAYPDPASLTLLQMNLSSLTGGVLSLKVSENDYSAGPSGAVEFNGEVAGTLVGNGSVAVSQYVDLTNLEFGTTGPAIMGTFGPGAFISELSVVLPYLTGPFALVQTALITLGPGSYTAIGINSIVHAPEPASMVLFGTGLVALAALARRMRRRES
jgi:hypothetical protein